MSDDFRTCLAFVVPPSRLCVLRREISSSHGAPSSPMPNLEGTVPQGMTFRPCCLGLVSSRLSDILMRWDLAGSQCKCHSLSFFLLYPTHSRPLSFFVSFSLRVARPLSLPNALTPVLRFPLSLFRSLFEYVWYNTEYHRNGRQWEMEMCTIVIWIKSNDTSGSNVFAYNTIAQLKVFLFAQLIVHSKLSTSLWYLSYREKIYNFSSYQNIIIIFRNWYISARFIFINYRILLSN